MLATLRLLRAFRPFLFLIILATVGSECPNACSAHGQCAAHDMCLCYRGWMANDCSQSNTPLSLNVLIKNS